MFFITAILLYLLWIIFSGRFDAFHLVLGAFSSLLVAFVSHDLLFQDDRLSLGGRLSQGFRFVGYIFWLIGQILMANISVLKLVFHPKVNEQITPKIFRFKTSLKDDFSKWVFANSITLTPGTVTIRIEGDEFVCHALTGEMADSLPGDMEKRIAAVFEPGQ